MKLLDQYIAKNLYVSTAAVLFVFSVLFIFIDFVSELEYMGLKQYGVWQVTAYVLLSLPQRLYELFPSAVLLGGLIALGGMASNSELVVLRSSGVTIFRLMRSVFIAGLVLALLVLVIGEFVAPVATSTAKSIRAKSLDQKVFSNSSRNFWAKDGQKYINVDRMLPNENLRNIDVYELNEDRQLINVTHIEKAKFVNGRWVLSNLTRSMIGENEVQTSIVESETWDELLNSDVMDVINLKPEDMSVVELYRYSEYLDENELDASAYSLSFWVKVFAPLTCLVMLLIALPMVFSGSARTGQTGKRIVIGLMLGLIFYIFNRFINYTGLVYGVPPVLSAAIPLLTVAFLTVVLIRKTG